jgi:cob(I)alamin adenosyltransferase
VVRFYTGLGDDGTTDLLGARVTKDDPRIDALGSLDEATSAIGLARSLTTDDRVREDLVAV